MEEVISIREYGRRRKCSDTLVRKKIKEGVIVKGVAKGKDGSTIGIYESVANSEWKEQFNPNYNRNDALQQEFAGEEPSASMPKSGGGVATLAAAKTAKAVYDAKLAELEYQTKSGKLVNKEDVYRTLFAFGQQMRDAFSAIPGRITDDMLAAPSKVDAVNLLTAEINAVLEKLADTKDLLR